MILLVFLVYGLAAGLIVFLVRSRAINRLLLLSVILFQTAISVYALFHRGEADSLYFRFDPLGTLFSLILSVLLYATLFHTKFYLQRMEKNLRNESIFNLSFIFLIISMNCAYFADHMGILWACIEATTLSVAGLIYHERTSTSLEATWKYVFVSSIGVTIAFTGILILTMAAREQGLKDLRLENLVAIAPKMSPFWLDGAFLLILTGYGAKIGLFPLHAAAVDAKTVTPYQVNGLISTALVNVGFTGVMRVLTITSRTASNHFTHQVLLLAGIISLAIAALQLQKVQQFKRMFAFSTLEHGGIVAIALAAGKMGIYAALFHLVLHSFAKASVFYQLGQIFKVYGSYFLKKSGNFLKLNPGGALVLILTVLTINAIPPSGLFVTEFMIFKALFQAHYIWQAVLAMVLVTFIVYILFLNIFRLLYGPSDLKEPVTAVKKIEQVPQIVLTGLILYLVVAPPLFISRLLESAAAAMGGVPW